ncbi:zinc finger B-box domain-containing protein 1 isoform X2 [Thalassophryne amazonica]|uniref:zinc finger B-box domain-containing protein 1 isoform X2 n=1 Tax=Thalassophryne amazonica TaxID=390379 RepID=UPI001471B49E|nr:zinc finger B-box domain-containing protein 1 isoform X2 [Thalassophryne amazonica]
MDSNEANSVKFSGRNLHLPAFRMETVTLAQQNKQMQEKLLQLKECMKREKEERRHSADSKWKAGQCGAVQSTKLTSSAKKNKVNLLKKLSESKVKIRVLKDEPFTATSGSKPAPSPSTKSLAMTRINRPNAATSEQCDIKMAELVLVEKGENFPNSLLGGKFDEEESARYFQEAVKQWREGKPVPEGQHLTEDTIWSTAQPVSVSVMAIKADLLDSGTGAQRRGRGKDRVPVNVEFTESSLTYLDRLLLKKHRRTPIRLDQLLLAFNPQFKSRPTTTDASTKEEITNTLTYK